jgi:hypothetical protein
MIGQVPLRAALARSTAVMRWSRAHLPLGAGVARGASLMRWGVRWGRANVSLRQGIEGSGSLLRAAGVLARLVVTASGTVVNLVLLPATALRVTMTHLLLRLNAVPVVEAGYDVRPPGPFIDYELPPTYAGVCAVVLVPTGVLAAGGTISVLPAVLQWHVLDARPEQATLLFAALGLTLVARALPEGWEAAMLWRASGNQARGGNPFALLLWPLTGAMALVTRLPAFLSTPLAIAGVLWLLLTKVAHWPA